MSQPNTQDWEDIIPGGTDAQKATERAGPFAVGHAVDGYVFTQERESPELRYQRQPQAEVPAAPRRELPRRIRDQVPGFGVWQPGGSARAGQPKEQTPRPSVVKALLSALIPLVLLVGGIYLIIHVYE